MSASINSSGKVKQLDLKAEPTDIIHPDDAADPNKLARLLNDVLANVNRLRRKWAADFIDYEDVSVSTSGATVRLQHNFSGRVRWRVVDWTDAATGAPDLRKDTTNTDANTLVLKSYVAGTVTIRVEPAG